MPGANGRSPEAAASNRSCDMPGLMAKAAPILAAWSRSLGVNTVPTPTTAPGTSAMMARAASTAASVRRVISITGKPPATSARASRAADPGGNITCIERVARRRGIDGINHALRRDFHQTAAGIDQAAKRAALDDDFADACGTMAFRASERVAVAEQGLFVLQRR